MVTRIHKHARGHLYIAEWMAEKGVTDEILAGRTHRSRTTMWRWRAQQHRLNPAKIAELAAAIGIEPEQLWAPPPPKGRPSLDLILKHASDELVQKMADTAEIFLRTGI